MDLCSYLYTCILWDYDRAMDICIYLSTCIHWDYDRAMESNEIIPRTSDSLNEGLPIKMTREKFQRKQYFFYEKDIRFNPRLIHKSSFLIGQVPIEKYGLKTLFLLFNI